MIFPWIGNWWWDNSPQLYSRRDPCYLKSWQVNIILVSHYGHKSQVMADVTLSLELRLIFRHVSRALPLPCRVSCIKSTLYLTLTSPSRLPFPTPTPYLATLPDLYLAVSPVLPPPTPYLATSPNTYLTVSPALSPTHALLDYFTFVYSYIRRIYSPFNITRT